VRFGRVAALVSVVVPVLPVVLVVVLPPFVTAVFVVLVPPVDPVATEFDVPFAMAVELLV